VQSLKPLYLSRFAHLGLVPGAILVVSAVIWAVPMLGLLASTAWQTESGSIGPLTLMMGLGVLWYEIRLHQRHEEQGNGYAFVLFCALGCGLYAVAIGIAFTALAVAAAWIVLVSGVYWLYGLRVLRKLWFPLLYLLLVVPLPYSLTYSGGAWLGAALAQFATELLHFLGLEAAYSGNMLFIDQYEMSVELACSGLSSTVSLIAVTIIYARWVHRSEPFRMGYLLALALPIAFLANLLRVALLAIAVHVQGTAVLHSAVHPLSGLFSFVLAIVLSLTFDKAISVALKVLK
jgi:exosortase